MVLKNKKQTVETIVADHCDALTVDGDTNPRWSNDLTQTIDL